MAEPDSSDRLIQATRNTGRRNRANLLKCYTVPKRPARSGESTSRESYPSATCNCEWEVRFGYGVAVTLAIFEAKRFLMLLLEIFAEWQVIKFAGGLQPVIFTFVDITVGFPSALIASRVLRSGKISRYDPRSAKPMRWLLLVVATCATLNVATLASIAYRMSVRQETLTVAFNASMRHYMRASMHKYSIDEIQLVFRCCGHTSYIDWFLFDWQNADYGPREDVMRQRRISDEENRGCGVPFSCCDIRSMMPCSHIQMFTKDLKTINTIGCAQVIAPVLARIVIIAYVMTSTLAITQALLVFLIGRVSEMHFPRAYATSSRHSIRDTETSISDSVQRPGDFNLADISSCSSTRRSRGTKRRRRTRSSQIRCMCTMQDRSTSNERCEAARIQPSVHEEHKMVKITKMRHYDEKDARRKR